MTHLIRLIMHNNKARQSDPLQDDKLQKPENALQTFYIPNEPSDHPSQKIKHISYSHLVKTLLMPQTSALSPHRLDFLMIRRICLCLTINVSLKQVEG